jgi:hypothetical protein
VLNLEAEIREFAPAGQAELLIAREQREIFSIHPELRVLSWLGAILIATGAGVLLARNIDRIGPVVLAGGIGLAAAAAYAYAFWRKSTSRSSLVDEYVLLLAALLLSADLAYIEGQFHLLDHGWPRHLLLLTIVHGLAAYYFASRTLLSLSLAALAGWMGIEQRVDAIFDSSVETGLRSFACAALILVWRAGHGRWKAEPDFIRVFEHFAANLALAGSVMLAADRQARWIGVAIALLLAAIVIRHAFIVRSEIFAIYAYVYAVIALMIVLANLRLPDEILTAMFAVTFIAAIAGLFVLHNRYRRERPA